MAWYHPSLARVCILVHGPGRAAHRCGGGFALGVLEARGMEADRLQELERFLREDTGRQFLMVNNIDSQG